MREYKNFWDRNAGLYDCFMRKDRAVYEKMYELIRPVVKDKTVLEVATGTGLIAKHIVKSAARIEATDASLEMITEAKRGNYSAKLRFSVQDMFSLPYASKSFDVVIVS
ncbi:MAG: class I SAM-dependent methyltransferase, partial [Eubacteriales bacterium]|nr:class I SAM-dependent methyltransferase [Eubacteriales bacterium]